MRISDWSSDVCSSDLADLSGYGNVTYGQDNQLTLEGAISGPLSDRVRVRVAGKWDRHDGHYKNLFVNAGQDSVLIGSGGGRIRTERSEEHTSELQSLMRISYAVFCLKTKILNEAVLINTSSV